MQSASIASCLKKDEFFQFISCITSVIMLYLLFWWRIFFHLSGVFPGKLKVGDTIYVAYKQAKEKYK